ncbi:phosphopantetheine-binding protein [Butyricimonas virosa]|jgi:acyl carrier protein|uniref:phosphopantetheine-binding protein n=1 Tax=Butyricimonas virosa TaxID=544645 RepID=UPI0032BF6E6D
MMKLEEFVQLFAEQFDDTSADTFTTTTEYKTLEEWGSLVALSVISMIDDEFGKRITGADLRNCVTIEELYNLIQSK